MKYFLKMFDKSQNTFYDLCWFLFSVNSFENLSGSRQFVQTSHQEELRKIRHVKQQIKSFELDDPKW